jgi:ribosomal protein S12 methylthiotransferase accessory factor
VADLFDRPANPELLSLSPASDIAADLDRKRRIVYRSNGSRSAGAEDFLVAARAAAERAGLTRLADITGLEFLDLPVFQATRPDVLLHHASGQNTGAQGKGLRPAQARISATMESVENFCAEPKKLNLVRASFNGLRRQKLVADPSRFTRCLGVRPISRDEPLMWTEALSLRERVPVLIPAETVYYPFLAADYRCRMVFPCSTNGLASGSTYQEALIHGLYEVIERHYWSLADSGRAVTSIVIDHERLCRSPEMKAAIRRLAEYEPVVLALTVPGIANLPMFRVLIRRDGQTYVGQGCSAEIETSFSRAASEAWQSLAGIASGSREDIASRREDLARRKRTPRARAAAPRRAQADLRSLDELRADMVDKRFAFLADEYRFVVEWLDRLGLRNLYACNLSRRGVDLPVVKVVVPGLSMPREALGRHLDPAGPTRLDFLRLRYGAN